MLNCLFFPIYRTWHFIALACSAVLVYVVLTFFFPGKTEFVEVPEEPERSGDEQIDALLSEGERAVAEMRQSRSRIQSESVRQKIYEIILVTDKIFKKPLQDASVFSQVKRFSDFYLPTTIKLLKTYDSFGQSGSGGQNVSGTMEQIDSALDTILDSYMKFYDSLFQNKALDIETDIQVLEGILRRDGLLNSELGIRNSE